VPPNARLLIAYQISSRSAVVDEHAAQKVPAEVSRQICSLVLQPVPVIALEGRHSARTVHDPEWYGMLPS